MDVDGPSSSPALRHTSLPPSSAPQASSNGHTPRRARPVADALAFDDEDDDMQEEDTSQRRRGRPRNTQTTINVDVPLVKDAVGESVRESFETFLKTFVLLLIHQCETNHCLRYTEDIALPMTPGSDGEGLPVAGDGELVYIEQIHTMREYELTTLYVDYGHLLNRDDVLADAIQKQYYRFLPYIRRALHNLVAEFEPEYLKLNPTSAAMDSVNLQTRDFNVAFYHLPLVSGIRELRTDKIGTLMSISGTVTRTSEVRPELLYGSFVCEVCGGLVNEIEQQFKYTEVS